MKVTQTREPRELLTLSNPSPIEPKKLKITAITRKKKKKADNSKLGSTICEYCFSKIEIPGLDRYLCSKCGYQDVKKYALEKFAAEQKSNKRKVK